MNRTTGSFGTAINCMDGRTQLPVINWVKEKYSVDYVDAVTEPGIDKILSTPDEPLILNIKTRVDISVKKHGSKVIVIVGHHDCAGNPTWKDKHLEQIKKSVNLVKGWGYAGVEVVGLWVDESFAVNVVE
jgi:hypothetical protein